MFAYARKYQLEESNCQLEIREQFSLVQIASDSFDENAQISERFLQFSGTKVAT